MSNNPTELQDEKENTQSAQNSEQGSPETTTPAPSDSPVNESPAESGPENNSVPAADDQQTGSTTSSATESDSGENVAVDAAASAAPVAAEETATENAANADTASADTASADTVTADTTTADTAGANAAVETPSSENADKDDASPTQSRPKIRIGSQRDQNDQDRKNDEVPVPKAVKDAQETTVPIATADSKPESPTPVGPSVEDLSAQWEKDALAGLDEQKVGELLSSAADGTDQELPVNSRIKGTVTKVFGDGVFFLLKGQYDGVVPLKQFKKEPEPGTMTDVVVTGFNANDNLYELALPGAAITVGDWSDLVVGNRIEVRITGSNTGGLECAVNNIRGFIPASQIDVSRVDNLGAFMNQTMECVITEANKKKRNLVLSRRAILEEELKERKKELLEQFEVGSIVEGKISKLRDFGAFVNIGNGVEGLVHISKCSWHHIKHPSEVFEEGQPVTVRIEKINKDTGKIQLSHRDTIEHPWKRAQEKYPPESTVKGTVSKIADFGAFIKLETGVEGLVHISEIAHQRVKSVGAVLSEGQEIEAKVLSVDPDKQKMSLSIKALLPAPEKEEKKEEAPKEPAREMAVKKRNKPLRGGTGSGSGGDQFGLKW